MTSFIEVAEAPMSQPISKQKTMIVMIPENLDLEKHLRDFKPEGFRPDIDKMKYLIGLLTELPYRNKRIFDRIKENDKIPFIRLSSQLLKKRIRNYQTYVGYLVETGIIEKDDDYQAGKYCMGYRFTKKFRTRGSVDRIKITESDTEKNLMEEMDESNYPALTSWFAGLDIDAEAARKYLQDLYSSQLARKKKRKRSKKMEKFYLKHSAYLLMVETIAEKEFFFTSDKFSNRLHTSLSNLKSELRNFLTYKGEPLAAIDLSCSQPFLILNLLEGSFYDSKSELLNLEKINKNINPLIGAPLSSPGTPHPIMCAPFEDSEVGAEIEIFKAKVKHNEFYKYCAEKLGKATDGKYSKDQMKKMIFSVIFSSNEEHRKHIVANKEMFDHLFPFISSVLKKWKAKTDNNLAKVLQRIESYLFLDCICARISEERPDLPIFTIHDSIATLASDLDYLQYVMYDEIQARTGFNPHFKPETWEIEKLMKLD